MLMLSLALFQAGHYFANATIYDADTQTMAPGYHILVDDNGQVELVARKPIQPPGEYKTVTDTTILPHYSDFYSLIQDRGLGMDSDLSGETQDRMARYFRTMGLYALRDPVFPRQGVTAALDEDTRVLAQQGYLELKGGPGRMFSLVIDPDKPNDDYPFPVSGPITLWWTDNGTGEPILWTRHEGLVQELINRFHNQGRRVGCFIQDADSQAVASANSFPFDFYEGIPKEDVDVSFFRKDLIWAPITVLNDHRYCAERVEKRLASASKLGLFGPNDLLRIQGQLDRAMSALRDRCLVWKKRRERAFLGITQWIGNGGAIAIGSAGGHAFSFSGGMEAELRNLANLGLSDKAQLAALFQHTPHLLGEQTPFLTPGKPAHFIVYDRQSDVLKLIGKRVSYNFTKGKLIK